MLGTTFTASVDLTTTGHSLATLFAFDGAIDRVLGGGRHVLAGDVGGHGCLYRSTLPGPIATFAIAVPADFALCGLRLSMQATHRGGVVPFALSNAIDLEIGL